VTIKHGFGRGGWRDVVCLSHLRWELSAFLDAPAELVGLEGELLARADLVFTGGRSNVCDWSPRAGSPAAEAY
jgi:hypothetical protein